MGRARDVLMRSFLFLRSPPPPTWCYTLGVLNVAGYIFPKGRNWKGEGEDERGCIKPRKRQETIRRILFSDPLPPSGFQQNVRGIDFIGLILTAANRHIRLQPSLATRRFIKTDTGRRTLYFSRVKLNRARHRSVPCREKSADSLFNGYLISF